MSTPEQRAAYVKQARERLAALTPEARASLEQSWLRYQAEAKAEREYADWLHANRYWQGW